MDDSHFDDLTRVFAGPSRRGIFGAAGAATLALLLGETAPETVAARKKKKKKTICHAGQTMKVPKSKVKVHLGHGDTLGPCPPSSPGPIGCAAGTRTCPDGRCVQAGGCCSDADCLPGGPCNTANGTCTCSNQLKSCPETPGRCDLCCTDADCPTGAECRDRACRCVTATAPCNCLATTGSTPIACGSGFSCFCVAESTGGSPPLVPRCASLPTTGTCSGCASTPSCNTAEGEFCGTCVFGSGNTCLTACTTT